MILLSCRILIVLTLVILEISREREKSQEGVRSTDQGMILLLHLMYALILISEQLCRHG